MIHIFQNQAHFRLHHRQSLRLTITAVTESQAVKSLEMAQAPVFTIKPQIHHTMTPMTNLLSKSTQVIGIQII